LGAQKLLARSEGQEKGSQKKKNPRGNAPPRRWSGDEKNSGESKPNSKTIKQK